MDLVSTRQTDPVHHQRVLAKTRQAVQIASAVKYNKAGEVTKAVLELHKALASNSICRTPAIVNVSKSDLAALYKLHITHTEQPPQFATLLQLQEMMGLSQQEAEEIENAVLRSPAAFSI
ncbi:uncharacterized protein HaLaN_00023 [Haematococcus lacustris]|uniref:Uncharacterized protein n=1 Tax=Haematococcus lacustris TaxID=44745 RepID=A0A699Y687_HAELA|nr:uncharacterized protein HaLaN_00023 [Haematococcus lacustris]